MASKFRLIAAENSPSATRCQQQILSQEGEIQPGDSDRLATLMRRTDSVSEVLARKLKDAGGITPPELARQSKNKVSPTAIKEILRGNTKNPGIFTLVEIAEALNLSPVQFLAEIIGDRTDEAKYKAGQFPALDDIYRGMTQAQRQKADVFLDGLLLQFRHIKNQK